MAKPVGDSAGMLSDRARFRPKQSGRRGLVAESCADGHALAAGCATAAEHGSAGLGLHASAEAMGFHAFASIGLKCALRHENALLFSRKNLRLDGKYLVYRKLDQESSGKLRK
jgi:hypothetical protein